MPKKVAGPVRTPRLRFSKLDSAIRAPILPGGDFPAMLPPPSRFYLEFSHQVLPLLFSGPTPSRLVSRLTEKRYFSGQVGHELYLKTVAYSFSRSRESISRECLRALWLACSYFMNHPKFSWTISNIVATNAMMSVSESAKAEDWIRVEFILLIRDNEDDDTFSYPRYVQIYVPYRYSLEGSVIVEISDRVLSETLEYRFDLEKVLSGQFLQEKETLTDIFKKIFGGGLSSDFDKYLESDSLLFAATQQWIIGKGVRVFQSTPSRAPNLFSSFQQIQSRSLPAMVNSWQGIGVESPDEERTRVNRLYIEHPVIAGEWCAFYDTHYSYVFLYLMSLRKSLKTNKSLSPVYSHPTQFPTDDTEYLPRSMIMDAFSFCSVWLRHLSPCVSIKLEDGDRPNISVTVRVDDRSDIKTQLTKLVSREDARKAFTGIVSATLSPIAKTSTKKKFSDIAERTIVFSFFGNQEVGVNKTDTIYRYYDDDRSPDGTTQVESCELLMDTPEAVQKINNLMCWVCFKPSGDWIKNLTLSGYAYEE